MIRSGERNAIKLCQSEIREFIASRKTGWNVLSETEYTVKGLLSHSYSVCAP